MARSTVKRPRINQRAQALVEFAVILPLMIMVAFGATAIDSYIQAQSFLVAAVNQASLVGARDGCDPCVPDDTCSTAASGANGFTDVVQAFQTSLNQAGSPFVNAGGNGKVYGYGESMVGDGNVTIDIECTNGAYATNNKLAPDPISGVLPITCISPPGLPIPDGGDGGCFSIWSGGVLSVVATAKVSLPWIPLISTLTVQARSAQVIEPYRSHTCIQATVNDC